MFHCHLAPHLVCHPEWLCCVFPTIASNYKRATPPLVAHRCTIEPPTTKHAAQWTLQQRLPSPQATTTTRAMISTIWTQNNRQRRHPCAMHLAVAPPQNHPTSTAPVPTHRSTTSADHCTTTLPYPAQEALRRPQHASKRPRPRHRRILVGA
jgi:hypothetical protein